MNVSKLLFIDGLITISDGAELFCCLNFFIRVNKSVLSLFDFTSVPDLDFLRVLFLSNYKSL